MLSLDAPILGYRAWRVGPEGLLTSMTHRVAWPSTGLHARCAQHAVPAEDHGCGVHGLSLSPEPSADLALAALARADRAALPFTTGIVGIAEAWGEVLITEFGWRAEFARPVALYARTPGSFITPERVEEIAVAYNVPVLGA